MTGDVKSTELAPTRLLCGTCASPLSLCSCTIEGLAASCRLEVRGSYIDGRPARELAAARR